MPHEIIERLDDGRLRVEMTADAYALFCSWERETTEAWIDDLEATPAAATPRRTAAQFGTELRDTEARMCARIPNAPWLTWGTDNRILEQALAQALGYGAAARRLGYEFETELGLFPSWSRTADVKQWARGLVAALEVAGDGSVETVMAAARQLLAEGLTVGDPWAVVKTTRALAAERRRGGAAGVQAHDEFR